MASTAFIRIKQCKQCGVDYAWRRGAMGGLRGCCTKECAAARDRTRMSQRWAEGYISPSRIPKKSRAPTPCVRCGGLTTRPRFCSQKCSHDTSKGIATPRWAACKECDKPMFVVGERRTFCSAECGNKAKWRKSSAIRRARIYGRLKERFDPMDVFIRDKWICHLCGKRTLPRLKGSLDNRAPQLDHIIPLAAGGEHTMRNTACSCRKCNMAKGAKPLGQMLLFA